MERNRKQCEARRRSEQTAERQRSSADSIHEQQADDREQEIEGCCESCEPNGRAVVVNAGHLYDAGTVVPAK